jgi:hypothetical protein
LIGRQVFSKDLNGFRSLVHPIMDSDPNSKKTNSLSNGYNHLMPANPYSPPPMPWFGMDIGKLVLSG